MDFEKMLTEQEFDAILKELRKHFSDAQILASIKKLKKPRVCIAGAQLYIMSKGG